MALGAPHFADPDERHGHARISLLRRSAGRWKHLGQVLPEGFSPGSREWSGSAVLGPEGREVKLYFTATGRRAERELTFEQRVFRATGSLVADQRGCTLGMTDAAVIIRMAELGDQAGPLGAIALAHDALREVNAPQVAAGR